MSEQIVVKNAPVGGSLPAGASLSEIATVRKDYVQTCINVFREARGHMMRAALMLYTIREQRLWEDDYSSFAEFLRDVQINATQASRLCSVIEHYVERGKVEFTKLIEANPETLYKAMKLPCPPEEQALRASMWTQQEMRAELARKPDGSEHECVALTICKTCGRRMQ